MDNKTKWQTLKVRFVRWIAYHLPHSLVYFAVLRATDYATSDAWEPRNEYEKVTASAVVGCWHAKKAWKDDDQTNKLWEDAIGQKKIFRN